MQRAEINDLSICCELGGDGYPLVLIMGLAADLNWWDPELLDALRKGFRVLAFDNRGAGRTSTPDQGEFTIAMFADDTASLMDAFGIERGNVLGLSMGGMIAQELALKYPDKVEKLVLCATHCGGKQHAPTSQEVIRILADQSGGIEGLFQRLLQLMWPSDYLEANPEFVQRFRERFMIAPITAVNAARQFMAILNHDTCDRLPEIKAPTLVATGTEDMLIPPENSRIIAERIPGAKLIEYQGAGHGFMWQLREAFEKDLLEFLGQPLG
jgi:pimeloyl-ACP methyl ester carboxylesterase